MVTWTIQPQNSSGTGNTFEITADATPLLQIAGTGTIGLGIAPTQEARLTVDGTVASTSFSGDGGPLTVSGQELAATLADLRTDVDASAPLTGATFRGAVTAPTFSGDEIGRAHV